MLTLQYAGCAVSCYCVQRTAGNRNKSLTPHLLIEFFRWFELNGKMQSLLHLPLTSMEDQYLVYFLKHLLSKKSVAPSPTNIDYLVLFLLQRNRIVEAVTLFDQHSTNGMDSFNVLFLVCLD